MQLAPVAGLDALVLERRQRLQERRETLRRVRRLRVGDPGTPGRTLPLVGADADRLVRLAPTRCLERDRPTARRRPRSSSFRTAGSSVVANVMVPVISRTPVRAARRRATSSSATATGVGVGAGVATAVGVGAGVGVAPPPQPPSARARAAPSASTAGSRIAASGFPLEGGMAAAPRPRGSVARPPAPRTGPLRPCPATDTLAAPCRYSLQARRGARSPRARGPHPEIRPPRRSVVALPSLARIPAPPDPILGLAEAFRNDPAARQDQPLLRRLRRRVGDDAGPPDRDRGRAADPREGRHEALPPHRRRRRLPRRGPGLRLRGGPRARDERSGRRQPDAGRHGRPARRGRLPAAGRRRRPRSG